MTMTPDEEANFLVIRTTLDEWAMNQQVDDSRTSTYSNTPRGEWTFDEPNTIKVRLDWEGERGAIEAMTDSEDLFQLLSLQIAEDLTELATHGRRPPQQVDPETGELPPHAHDPLLSLADGTVVHGKTLDSLVIHETHTYTEFKATKDAYEFTVFMALTFQWAE
jgi:hypothetical protein